MELFGGLPQQLYQRLQDQICAELERVDGSVTFSSDRWERLGGGGGLTRVLANGRIFEKATVGTAAVWGVAPSVLAEELGEAAGRFAATGISLIVHPRNPHVPTIHANLRYLQTDDGRAWFGGGTDLTPFYLYEEDARHFHGVIAEVCGRHPTADYPAWKEACDRYFHLPHRGEARGVGGIFFDHREESLAEVLRFQEDLGYQLMPAYLPIVAKRKDIAYGEAEEHWHLQRRGRYVEFNLLFDRGTRFGLQTEGRTESILASLPPRARWDYAAVPSPESPEAALVEVLTGPPRRWV